MLLRNLIVSLGVALLQVEATTSLELVPPPAPIYEPWQVTSLHYNSDGSNKIISATIYNPNNYIAGGAGQGRQVGFSKTTANCTAQWNGASPLAFPQGTVQNCTLVGEASFASWTFEALQARSWMESVDMVFTLTQYVTAYGGYWKVLTGAIHLEEGIHFDQTCNENDDCSWNLRSESTSVLVNTTMISYGTDSFYYRDRKYRCSEG
ncbi:hypothetical protein F5Y04DRAFT_290228 [Hypomontagnella monticulosa]|nr:hypothetical protein F5Y04DRAFT_290228 [Hypomontagnella monticulosa]